MKKLCCSCCFFNEWLLVILLLLNHKVDIVLILCCCYMNMWWNHVVVAIVIAWCMNNEEARLHIEHDVNFMVWNSWVYIMIWNGLGWLKLEGDVLRNDIFGENCSDYRLSCSDFKFSRLVESWESFGQPIYCTYMTINFFLCFHYKMSFVTHNETLSDVLES